MECFSKGENLEVFDWVNEIQFVVIDQEEAWLQDLLISDEHRQEIFRHFCLATSRLVDAMFSQEKYDKLMGPYREWLDIRRDD
jgi:hypothetical protein